MNIEEAKQLSKKFIDLNTEINARLKRGAEKRKAVADAAKSDKPSSDARVTWVRKTINEVAKLLRERADLYNGSQTNDRVDTKDILDILGWTISLLKKRSEK